MMKSEKEFDAVSMMRKIRNKHHEEYSNNPQLRDERLTAIREKYKGKIRSNKTVHYQ